MIIPKKVRCLICAQELAMYPNLFKQTKRYLYMPASLVSCEQIFSKAGEVVSKKRSRLMPNSVKMILFFNENL